MVWSDFAQEITRSTELRESISHGSNQEREQERNRDREREIFDVTSQWQLDPQIWFFYENATAFIFKKIKTPKSFIKFLYSNLIFLDTENEN